MKFLRVLISAIISSIFPGVLSEHTVVSLYELILNELLPDSYCVDLFEKPPRKHDISPPDLCEPLLCDVTAHPDEFRTITLMSSQGASFIGSSLM